MLLTVEGAYRDGEIELAEIPENVEQADVLVIFLKTKKNPSTPPSSVESTEIPNNDLWSVRRGNEN